MVLLWLKTVCAPAPRRWPGPACRKRSKSDTSLSIDTWRFGRPIALPRTAHLLPPDCAFAAPDCAFAAPDYAFAAPDYAFAAPDHAFAAAHMHWLVCHVNLAVLQSLPIS